MANSWLKRSAVLAVLFSGCQGLAQTAPPVIVPSPATAPPVSPSPTPLDEWQVPLHEATTPVARDQAWLNHLAWMKRQKDERPIDLVFLGDSVTHSWAFQGEELWEHYYGHRNAVNFGSGADLTQHVLWRIDNGNFEGIQPKLVVIQIGTNNSPHNTPEEIADGVMAIAQKLRRQLPETKLLLLAIFPRGQFPYDDFRKRSLAANEIFREIADDRYIFYLDIGGLFMQEDELISNEIMSDYLHLTPRGYRIWAEAIEDEVAELLGEKVE